ncbi:hypothetical protein GOODEAATRI_032700 [Goodea atripinnis]|uniref:Uncharacterized protein n=1 Tax=Goodea atripinnis TaxID=208336 RepID=A0ABV0MX30_9TELE
MLKLNSLQDLETLALTSWNIRQPAEDCNSREEALSSGEHGEQGTTSLLNGEGVDHSGLPFLLPDLLTGGIGGLSRQASGQH